MDEILENLANDVKAKVLDTCAKVAEIHRIKGTCDNPEYQRGYNAAVADITAKIRKLHERVRP